MNQFNVHNSYVTLENNIQQDCLNMFREEFFKFENQVLNRNSLRSSEASNIDHKLPSLLIEYFAKFIQLWKNFVVLRDIIQEERLERIRDELNACLDETKTSPSEMICHISGEKTQIEKNNLKCAFNSQEENIQHEEKLKLQIENINIHDTYLLSQNESFCCTLCKKKFSTEKDVICHISSLQHQKQELMCNYSDQDFVELDGVYYCRLCRCELLKTKDCQLEHLQKESHKLQVKCQKVLLENKQFVCILNHENWEFECKLCDITDSGLINFLQHCKMINHCTGLRSTSSEHQNKEKCFSTENGNSKNLPMEDFILCLDNHYECTLCQCNLRLWEIANHKREKKHQEKRNEFLKYSHSISVNKDNDLEFCSMLKNCDFYIEELNLTTEGKKVFKCLLCTKTCKGLDNLESHCLSQKHSNLKSHIEHVSQIFSETDTLNISENVDIQLIADVYFCCLCDVIIDKSVNVTNHKETKKHILMKELHEMQIQNRACITKLTNNPKLFLCYLCNKQIQGDINIIEHSKSGRHKMLLEIVLKLNELQ